MGKHCCLTERAIAIHILQPNLFGQVCGTGSADTLSKKKKNRGLRYMRVCDIGLKASDETEGEEPKYQFADIRNFHSILHLP